MKKRSEINITKHALERLDQRVRPKTRGAQNEYLSSRGNAERVLYTIVNRQELTLVEDKLPEGGGEFYDTRLRSYDGVIPLRILIRENALVTLWATGGWRRVGSQS